MSLVPERRHRPVGAGEAPRIGNSRAPAERAADRLADPLTHQRQPPHTSTPTPTIHCTACAGSDVPCPSCAASARRLAPAPRSTEARRNPLIARSLSGPAAPLPAATRQRFEHRLGQDLGHIGLHRGQAADVATAATNASAFAMGSDIVLGRRTPAPNTKPAPPPASARPTPRPSGTRTAWPRRSPRHIRSPPHASPVPAVAPLSGLRRQRPLDVTDVSAFCAAAQRDAAKLRTELSTKESELTGLFESAYGDARGVWVGLPVLDQQAAEFTRLRAEARGSDPDPNHESLDARWRAIDARLQPLSPPPIGPPDVAHVPANLRFEVDTEVNAAFVSMEQRRTHHGLIFRSELDAIVLQQGAQQDAGLAAQIDAGGAIPDTPQARPFSDEEISALHRGDLADHGGRLTSTRHQFDEQRRLMMPIRSTDMTEMDYERMSRVVQRQWARVANPYRYRRTSLIDTYPEASYSAGLNPVVTPTGASTLGSNGTFGGPALFTLVMPVNADAVTAFGPNPIAIRHSDLGRLRPEDEARFNSSAPGP